MYLFPMYRYSAEPHSKHHSLSQLDLYQLAIIHASLQYIVFLPPIRTPNFLTRDKYDTWETDLQSQMS